MKKLFYFIELLILLHISTNFAGNTGTKQLPSANHPLFKQHNLNKKDGIKLVENKDIDDALEFFEKYSSLPNEIKYEIAINSNLAKFSISEKSENIVDTLYPKKLPKNHPAFQEYWKNNDKCSNPKLGAIKLQNSTNINILLFNAGVSPKQQCFPDIIPLPDDKKASDFITEFSPNEDNVTLWIAEVGKSTIDAFVYNTKGFNKQDYNNPSQTISVPGRYIHDFKFHPTSHNLLLLKYTKDDGHQYIVSRTVKDDPSLKKPAKKFYDIYDREKNTFTSIVPPIDGHELTFKDRVGAHSYCVFQVNLYDKDKMYYQFKLMLCSKIIETAKQWLALKNPNIEQGKKILDHVKKNQNFSPYFLIFNAQKEYNTPCPHTENNQPCNLSSCCHRNLFKDIYQKITSRSIVTR